MSITSRTSSKPFVYVWLRTLAAARAPITNLIEKALRYFGITCACYACFAAVMTQAVSCCPNMCIKRIMQNSRSQWEGTWRTRNCYSGQTIFIIKSSAMARARLDNWLLNISYFYNARNFESKHERYFFLSHA